jgi:hypothetical protein
MIIGDSKPADWPPVLKMPTALPVIFLGTELTGRAHTASLRSG